MRSEIRLIPWWAYPLAMAALVTPFFLHSHFWPDPEAGPPLALQLLFPPLIGLVLAFLVLLIGYVNRDAGRRGVSRTLWTILVILVPNGIGFVMYFLLRPPLRPPCPECGTAVDQNANYCPRCGHGFRPVCPQCKSAVEPVDTFCAQCRAALK